MRDEGIKSTIGHPSSLILHLSSFICFVSTCEGETVFKGLGNLANFGALMKQAQEMGGRMQALQEELKTKKATGSAGGGLVEVDVNGLSEVLAVRIDSSLVEKGEREMIEDLLPAAFNAATWPW